MVARTANPTLMGFHTKDDSPEFNPYTYTYGNPINRTDPTGHIAIPDSERNTILTVNATTAISSTLMMFSGKPMGYTLGAIGLISSVIGSCGMRLSGLVCRLLGVVR
jgi:hypothetical protein